MVLDPDSKELPRSGLRGFQNADGSPDLNSAIFYPIIETAFGTTVFQVLIFTPYTRAVFQDAKASSIVDKFRRFKA